MIINATHVLPPERSAALTASESTRAFSADIKQVEHRAPPPTAAAPRVLPPQRIGASYGPTGSGAPEATATPPSARRQRRKRSQFNPRAVVLPQPPQHLHVPTSTPSCAHLQRRLQTSTHPTGSDAAAAILAPPGTLPQRRWPTSSQPKGSWAPEATSTPPGARPLRHTYNSLGYHWRHPRPPQPTGTRANAPTLTPPDARP